MTNDFLWERFVIWLGSPIRPDSNFLFVELFALVFLGIFVSFLTFFVRRRLGRRGAKQEALAPSTPAKMPEASAAPTSAPIPTPTPAAKPQAKPVAAPKAAATWTSALTKTREPLLSRLQDALGSFRGKAPWNEDHPLWEALEEILLSSDLGPRLTYALLEQLKGDFREEPDLENLKAKLRERILEVFAQAKTPTAPSEAPHPRVTVLVGVNGSGKTTTTGKLAYQAKQKGRSVIVGAGDTFRAAAVEQLQAWANRIGIECVGPAQGANPAAVAFDTVAAGIARDCDEIILDTAGRLHTKESLMDELKKVVRVIDKKLPGAPHRVLLVLDSTQGQNALSQAREFLGAVQATGLVLTKLDGSSKGGATVAIVAELGLPVEFVGLGEEPDDLRPFSAPDFVANLI